MIQGDETSADKTELSKDEWPNMIKAGVSVRSYCEFAIKHDPRILTLSDSEIAALATLRELWSDRDLSLREYQTK